MKLIVGLGNPGKNYQKTRHNIGFMILDAWQARLQESSCPDWNLSKKFNAEICEFNIKKEKVILAKPMTYMNASGQSVQLIAHYYKIKSHDIIVVHDDKDIDLGKIKIQNEKNSAGHNGVQSIMDHLKTKDFTRIRIGVASQNKRKMTNTAKFVLNKFGLTEKSKLKTVIQDTISKLEDLTKK